MKTSELIGPTLDWAVAVAQGLTIDNLMGGAVWAWTKDALTDEDETIVVFRPSAEWSQGGPIIERLGGFELKVWLESKPDSKCEAHIHNYEGNWIQFGPTPLIAAMRCYVASKLGDEVDIPKELT